MHISVLSRSSVKRLALGVVFGGCLVQASGNPSIFISKDLLDTMGDNDLIAYLDNLDSQRVSIAMEKAEDLNVLKARIVQSSLSAEHKERLCKPLFPPKKSSRDQLAGTLATLVDTSDGQEYEEEVDGEAAAMQDVDAGTTPQEETHLQAGPGQRGAMNEQEGNDSPEEQVPDVIEQEAELPKGNAGMQESHEEGTPEKALPADLAPMLSEGETSTTSVHEMPDDTPAIVEEEPPHEEVIEEEGEHAGGKESEQFGPQSSPIVSGKDALLDEDSEAADSLEVISQEINDQAAPAHGMPQGTPIVQLAVQQTTVVPVQHKQQEFSVTEQKEIIIRLLSATRDTLKKTGKKKKGFVERTFIKNFFDAFHGSVPETLSDGITSLYATPETVYQKIAGVVGGTQVLTTYMTLDDFYRVVEPWGLMMLIVRDFCKDASGVVDGKHATEDVEKLINSLSILDRGAFDQKTKGNLQPFFSIMQQEHRLVESGAYKGLLKDALIIPLARDYAVIDFLYGVTNLVTQIAIGLEKSLAFTGLMDEAKKTLINCLRVILHYELQEINKGTGQYTLKDTKQRVSSRDYTRLLQGLMAPLIHLVATPESLTSEDIFTQESLQQAIDKVFDDVKKKLDELAQQKIKQSAPRLIKKHEDERVLIEHTVRTFLVDTLQKRFMNLHKASKTL